MFFIQECEDSHRLKNTFNLLVISNVYDDQVEVPIWEFLIIYYCFGGCYIEPMMT